jgi:hypothetical protein
MGPIRPHPAGITPYDANPKQEIALQHFRLENGAVLSMQRPRPATMRTLASIALPTHPGFRPWPSRCGSEDSMSVGGIAPQA